MATLATGQPPTGVAQPTTQPPPSSYATVIVSPTQTIQNQSPTLPIRHPQKINGRPTMIWNSKEVQQSIASTKLMYGIIGKFTYGSPDLNDLRKVIPSQCEVKGHSVIGSLDYRSILIRCALFEDYVNLLSKSHWLKIGRDSSLMRTLKWDPWCDPKKETSIAIGWISFPNLPPNFFVKECIFSLALAVGKPLNLDAATLNHTRPSCARVKVEIDLLGELPDEIDIVEVDEETGKKRSKCIKIVYDYLPKYCAQCCLQGHADEECRVLHPELCEDNYAQIDKKEDKDDAKQPKTLTSTKVLKSGKIVGEAGPTGAKDNKLHENNGSQVRKIANGGRWQNSNRDPNVWQLATKKKNEGAGKQIIQEGIGKEEVTRNVNAFSVLQVEEEENTTNLNEAVKINVKKVDGESPIMNGNGDKDSMNDNKNVHNKSPRVASDNDKEDHALSIKNVEDAHATHELSSHVLSTQNIISVERNEVVPKEFQLQDISVEDKVLEFNIGTRNDRHGNMELQDIVDQCASENAKSKNNVHTLQNNVSTDVYKKNVIPLETKVDAHVGKGVCPGSSLNGINKHGSSLIASCSKAPKAINDLYPENALIPTAHLERMCKSASHNLGKPNLNINAPSFWPKSVMQVVPHLKKVLNDDELLKQMDWHDTRGILARQANHRQVHQGHYLVENDDLFEEEELDEDSTAYNFSIVAREGDLSPRPIRDKAPKKVMKERRPLEPTRVQPSRSTKSKKYKDWKKSKK